MKANGEAPCPGVGPVRGLLARLPWSSLAMAPEHGGVHTHTQRHDTHPPPLKTPPPSYKWAEVLSADAFAAFEDAGLDDDGAVQATGRRFAETVLALGGGRAPDLVFQVH